MILPVIWNEFSSHLWAAELINHLWQSTIVTFIAWLLVLILRDNHARTRYWIWMIASAKFLVPFSLLIAGGESLRSLMASPIAKPAVANVMEQIAQPFPQVHSFVSADPAGASHPVNLLPFLFLILWTCGASAVAISWCIKWQRIRAVVRAARLETFAPGVPVLSSSSLVEPGVFGIFRQVLLLPEGIVERLTQPQLDAIFAHEMSHVRRRDNLTFAIHMVVETLFWFHPVVWWIGTRLVEERELACDEAVLQSGSEPDVYAEGILNVCKFYVESPLACVSGVSGSDLKKRVVRIMTEKIGQNLTLGRRLLLSSAGFAAVALPIAIGLAHTAQLLAQSHIEEAVANLPRYEVATIKPNKADDGMFGIRFSPDGVSMTGVPLQFMLRVAFGVEEDRLQGMPGWAKSDHFNIDAKVDASDAPKLENLTPAQRNTMLLPLLTDRFNLKYHHETKELPIYALVLANGGSKLKEAKPDDALAKSGKHRMMMKFGGGNIEAQGSSIENLMQSLSPLVGRTIIDKTGLTGKYDFALKWTPDDGPAPMAGGPGGGPPRSDASSVPDAGGPSIFTALQEQLGLKLEPQKGPVDVIVIDHIDPPSPN
jgi:bla regulator protein blaR1